MHKIKMSYITVNARARQMNNFSDVISDLIYPYWSFKI